MFLKGDDRDVKTFVSSSCDRLEQPSDGLAVEVLDSSLPVCKQCPRLAFVPQDRNYEDLQAAIAAVVISCLPRVT